MKVQLQKTTTVIVPTKYDNPGCPVEHTDTRSCLGASTYFLIEKLNIKYNIIIK